MSEEQLNGNGATADVDQPTADKSLNIPRSTHLGVCATIAVLGGTWYAVFNGTKNSVLAWSLTAEATGAMLALCLFGYGAGLLLSRIAGRPSTWFYAVASLAVVFAMNAMTVRNDHATAQPAASIAADDWDVVASAFEHQHPDISYGQNTRIMQANVNRLSNQYASSADLLQAAYAVSRQDPAWTANP